MTELGSIVDGFRRVAGWHHCHLTGKHFTQQRQAFASRCTDKHPLNAPAGFFERVPQFKLIAQMQATPQDNAETAHPTLSAKEWQILKCLANGDSYETASNRLRISINTFRYYVKKIYRIIHVENRSEAVKWYYESIK